MAVHISSQPGAPGFARHVPDELVAVVGSRILRAVAKTAGTLSWSRWRGAAGARRVRGREQGHGHDHRRLRRLDGQWAAAMALERPPGPARSPRLEPEP